MTYTFDCEIDNTLLLMIDMQERFVPAIPDMAATGICGRNCERLLAGMNIFSMPTVITEQYKKGLGETQSFLLEEASRSEDCTFFEKSAFSALDDEDIHQHLATVDKENIILCGIESHVCVLSSCADLIRHGYRVSVAGDAVASRDPLNKEMALAAMRDLGALVLPTESILFRLQRRSGGDSFKALSALVK